MPVGAECEFAFFCEEEFACFEVECGHDSLREESDVGGVEAEVIMLVEEGYGCTMIHGACHDVPGDGGVVFDFGVKDLFCEKLEERSFADGGSGVGSFWAIPSEASSLSACYAEYGYFFSPDEVFAEVSEMFGVVWCWRVFGIACIPDGWLDVFG